MRHSISIARWLLCGAMLTASLSAFAMPSPSEAGQDTRAAISEPLSRFAQAAQPAAPKAPQPATAAAVSNSSGNDEPVGNVVTLTGTATLTRNNASSPLKLKDDIFKNDVLKTSANSTLGVTFNDATTFNLTANAQITIDNFVYEDGGKANTALFNIGLGTVAFVASGDARHSRHQRPGRSAGGRGGGGHKQREHQALSRS